VDEGLAEGAHERLKTPNARPREPGHQRDVHDRRQDNHGVGGTPPRGACQARVLAAPLGAACQVAWVAADSIACLPPRPSQSVSASCREAPPMVVPARNVVALAENVGSAAARGYGLDEIPSGTAVTGL